MNGFMWCLTIFTPNFSVTKGSSGMNTSKHWTNTHERHKFDCLSRGGTASLFRSNSICTPDMRWDWD